jgi:hypothetical protein
VRDHELKAVKWVYPLLPAAQSFGIASNPTPPSPTLDIEPIKLALSPHFGAWGAILLHILNQACRTRCALIVVGRWAAQTTIPVFNYERVRLHALLPSRLADKGGAVNWFRMPILHVHSCSHLGRYCQTILNDVVPDDRSMARRDHLACISPLAHRASQDGIQVGRKPRKRRTK